MPDTHSKYLTRLAYQHANGTLSKDLHCIVQEAATEADLHPNRAAESLGNALRSLARSKLKTRSELATDVHAYFIVATDWARVAELLIDQEHAIRDSAVAAKSPIDRSIGKVNRGHMTAA
jgi:hypothetical protein